jgi:uncharacterized membrane protein YesL
VREEAKEEERLFRRAFRVLATAAYDFWDNLIVGVTANLIWSAFLIPALLVGLLPLPAPFNLIVIFVVLGLTAGFATIGIYHMTSDMRREERIELGDYWRGTKQFWVRGLILMLLNALFAILVYANIYFYTTQFGNSPVAYLSIIWIYLAVIWLIMQMYVWTQAVRGDFNLKIIFRNALLVTFKYPQFTLPLGLIYLGIFVGLVFVMSVTPIVFCGAIFHAMLSNRAWNAILERENELAKQGEKGESES